MGYEGELQLSQFDLQETYFRYIHAHNFGISPPKQDVLFYLHIYCCIQIDSSLYLSLLLPPCNEFDQSLSLVVLPILNNGVPCSCIFTI